MTWGLNIELESLDLPYSWGIHHKRGSQHRLRNLLGLTVSYGVLWGLSTDWGVSRDLNTDLGISFDLSMDYIDWDLNTYLGVSIGT